MKNIFKLLLLALFFNISLIQAQNNNSIKTIWPQDDTLKQFFGTIGDVPVEIFIKRHGDKLDGFLNYIYCHNIFPGYRLDTISEKIYNPPKNIAGTINKDGDIRLTGFGIFNGYCSKNKIEGTWTDFTKDSLKYSFKLDIILYDDWLTCTNYKLGIEFKYPPNAVLKTSYGDRCCEDYQGNEIFRKDKKVNRDFIEINIPLLDSTSNLKYRELFISTWQEDTCCSRAKVLNRLTELDTFYMKQLGSNQYYVQVSSDNAMGGTRTITYSFSVCRPNDKRCFVFNYFIFYKDMGFYDVPYNFGFYNYDHKEEFDKRMDEYFHEKLGNYDDFHGPIPYNERAETDMIEHVISSFKFIEVDSIYQYLDKVNDSIPSAYTLYQNYPNPFAGGSGLKFDLPEKVDVVFNFYNVTDSLVDNVLFKKLDAGKYKLDYYFLWRHVPNGIYYYEMVTDNFKDKKKMVIVK